MRFLSLSVLIVCVLGFSSAAQAQPAMLEAKPLLAEEPAPAVSAPVTPPAVSAPVDTKPSTPTGRQKNSTAQPAPSVLPDLTPDVITKPSLGYAPPENLSNEGESIVAPSQEPWQRREPRRRKGETAEQIFAKLPSDIQSQILSEAELVHQECNQYKIYSQFHDCDCMGATYFEERVFTPEVSKDTVVGRISGECVSLPGAAGYGYDQCLAGMRYVLVPHRVDEFCTCFANQFGKNYQQSPYPDFDNIRAISKRTNTYCLKEVPRVVKSLNR